MKTERIGAARIEQNIRDRLNEACGRIETMEKALRLIRDYPSTTTEGATSDHMRAIAKEAIKGA